MEWAIHAGVHSADVSYRGDREIKFPDGGEISYKVGGDKIWGLVMGRFGH